jgi:hypothetical protein
MELSVRVRFGDAGVDDSDTVRFEPVDHRGESTKFTTD